MGQNLQSHVLQHHKDETSSRQNVPLYLGAFFTAAGAKVSVGARYDSFIRKTELGDIFNHNQSYVCILLQDDALLLISLLFLGLNISKGSYLLLIKPARLEFLQRDSPYMRHETTVLRCIQEIIGTHCDRLFDMQAGTCCKPTQD